MSSKDLDVVIYGAGGFTGTLVTARLAACLHSKAMHLRWAVAGRRAQPLDGLVTSIPIKDGCPRPKVFVAAVNELEALTRRTRLLINCAGPFVTCGESVLKACITGQCDYVDVCGEPAFFKIAQRYGADAAAAGVSAVVCCGYDCVPAEVVALDALSTLEKSSERPRSDPLVSLDTFLRTNDGLSSGTVRTLLTSLAASPSQRASSSKTDSRAAPRRRSDGTWWVPKYIKSVGFVVPLPSADPHVVRQTCATLTSVPVVVRHWYVAEDFAQWLKLIVVAAVLVVVARMARARNFIEKQFPEYAGPGPVELSAGRCELRCVARRKENGAISVAAATLTTSHIYTTTATCVVNAALLMLTDKSSVRLGVSTPGIALSAKWNEFIAACHPDLKRSRL